MKARTVQDIRFKDHTDIHVNAQMSTQQVREICNIGEDGKWVLQMAMERQGLSARKQAKENYSH